MRKFYLVVLLAVMVACVGCAQDAAAEVFQFDKEKVVVGAEFTKSEKDMETLDVLGLNISGVGSIGAQLKASDLELTQMLVTLGYELNPYVIPYAIAGVSYLDFDLILTGVANGRRGGGSLDLLTSDYNGGSAFTYGGGLRGQLLELPQEVMLTYDVRHVRFEGDDYAGVTLLPACRGGYHLDGRLDVEYAETSGVLALSKEIKFGQEANEAEGIEEDKAIIESVTPAVGVKLSHVDLNVNPNAEICRLTASSEQNLKGDLVSLLLGADVKVNDSVTGTVTGTIGDDMSIGGALTLRF